METVSNLTSAASRAIWGETSTQPTESGQEPVSGQNGDVAKGEPYDAGNLGDSTETEPTSTKSADTESKTMGTGSATTDAPGNTASTGPIRSEHDTDKTGVTSAHQPSSGFSSDKPTSSNDNSGPGAAPSVGADPASGAQTESKHQGTENPHAEPDHEENQAIKETKAEAEEAQSVDTSGPGPQSLEEKAKNGGTAAGAGSSGGDDDGPQKESHGEGTGEQYVKSSGMKADGGDFDAANPGAGREADRLLETKGIHHTVPGESAPQGDDETSQGANETGTEKSGKLSLGDKIKAKLHKK